MSPLEHTTPDGKPTHAYDQSQFDSGYYGGGARGGFTSYRYDEASQQNQLGIKWGVCHQAGAFNSVLFVGCAKGFEVKYFRARKKTAYGVDISTYAIANAEPEAREFVWCNDGAHLEGIATDGLDLVAAFDVLTLVPEAMLDTLISEMVRVAKNAILVRTVTKDFRNWYAPWDGEDGVTFRYLPFHEWDRHFSQQGKFHFFSGGVNSFYEGTYIWKRNP